MLIPRETFTVIKFARLIGVRAKASFKEKAPTDIVQHVLDCIGAVGRVERDMMVKNEYMAVVT